MTLNLTYKWRLKAERGILVARNQHRHYSTFLLTLKPRLYLDRPDEIHVKLLLRWWHKGHASWTESALHAAAKAPQIESALSRECSAQ